MHTTRIIHTHPFNSPFSGTTRMGQYQKGKTNLDFTEARDSEWQWHQLGHMQVCTSLQTDKPRQHLTTQFFTGWMPLLPPNQQHQSTEGMILVSNLTKGCIATLPVRLSYNWFYIVCACDRYCYCSVKFSLGYSTHTHNRLTAFCLGLPG